MKISYQWLRQYIDLPESIDELKHALTFSGIEVEGMESIPALPDSVVSCRIISAEKLEGSDHLHVCMIDAGDGGELHQVVCGAPNCHSGMIGVLALPGTQLKDVLIKKAKLRGVESAGMLCSERELGISDNHAGIIELADDTPIGISVNALYDLPDTIFELEITPNRSDLLGYFGIVRDLSASLNKALKLPPLPQIEAVASETHGLKLVLDEPELCPRYTARLIRNVRVSDSPQWLKNALIKSGLRPINNIVDITNYVMLVTGHPLHAFDYHKLAKQDPSDPHPAIVVRKAYAKEPFAALDGKDYVLDGEELVIADGEKASAIAGVIGGRDSAITDQTTAIILESAAFHPGSIRKTAYKHKISTDSSYRFERHLCDFTPPHVSALAIMYILELAGGEVTNELYDAYPKPWQAQYLALRPCRFEQIIGYKMPEAQITTYLEKLGLKFLQYGDFQPGMLSDPDKIYCFHGEQVKAGITEFSPRDECVHALYFSVPPYRVDLTREVDLIEELARLDGYDKVPQKTPVSLIMDRHAYRIRKLIAAHFRDCGVFETLGYSFMDPQQLAQLGFEEEELAHDLIRLINPQSSNQSVLRVSLIPQLLNTLSYNINHGERDLKLMEMAKLYIRTGDSHVEPLRLTALFTGKMASEHWKAPNENLGFYHIKGVLESLFTALQLENCLAQPAKKLAYLLPSDSLEFSSNGVFCARMGRINPARAEAFGIDTTSLKQDIWLIDVDVEALITLTRANHRVFNVLPKHPAVVRDLSFLISNEVSWTDIQAAIMSIDPALIQKVGIFDEYRGKQVPEGFRSISLHIFMQDQEKTLTDERVDQLIVSTIKVLQDTWGAKMR